MRGDAAPIIQEQQQLRQEMQDLASGATSVLYNTVVRSEQSMAALRQDTGIALPRAETTIG